MAIKIKAFGSWVRMMGKIISNANSGRSSKSNGFSLIEVMIGIALMGFALLALIQMLYFSVMNNVRSDKMTQATFLAQQRIDFLRGLNADELGSLAGTPTDELIDINHDGIFDSRRITQIQTSGLIWNVRILVFSAEQGSVALTSLVDNPGNYGVRADINTVISR